MRPDLIQNRIDKAERLREMGVNPYPYRFERTHQVSEVLANFDEEEAKEDSSSVAVAGRIVSLRLMGKAAFAHVQDASGKIQLYIKRDDVGTESYKAFKLLDLGDLLGVRGTRIRTRTGEASIAVTELEVLSKAIRPLPVVKEKEGEVFDAWKDTGARYRRRYLDLILNPDSREAFRKRSAVVRALRDYLDERDFVEVETPVLQAIYGGAMARPFETYHNALDMPFFMRIALELPLKRLLVGGFDRVYELGRVFRNEGVDRSHNPEFTMLEFYWAYADYHDAMDLVEDLCRTVVKTVTGGMTVEWDGKTIDFEPAFPRVRMVDLIAEKTGLDVLKDPEEKLRSKLGEAPDFATRGHLIEELFDQYVQGDLVQPTFVMDHPLAISPLAKVNRHEPELLVERFEIFIGGIEFGNAFSELNDPVDQRRRFEEQAAQRERGNDEAQVLDEDYLEAMEYGMPPAAGVGLGVDRLAMLVAGTHALRDVLLFPHMRPEEGRGAEDEVADTDTDTGH